MESIPACQRNLLVHDNGWSLGGHGGYYVAMPIGSLRVSMPGGLEGGDEVNRGGAQAEKAGR